MEHPANLSIKNFTYDLPEERIAKYPLPERDNSKLLIYQNETISEDLYRNISSHLPCGATLFFNDTKVIEARIFFQKPSGGVIEIFCLEPAGQDEIASSMSQKKSARWNCLIGGAGKWKHGMVLEKKISNGSKEIILQASIADRLVDCFVIEFRWNPANLSFAEILHLAGIVPLPPYIKRKVESADSERYQTVYAHFEGSVAAPTAGLHFTKQIFDSLQQKNINCEFLTLHVGAGTFKPVKSEIMQDHELHSEFMIVNRRIVELILSGPENIFCVGTTSLRTVESIYWMGVKTFLDPQISQDDLEIRQWDVYDDLMNENISVEDSLNALLTWMTKNKTGFLSCKTQLFVAPGYPFKIISGLITNFHQPQSTLLLLVAALIGDRWKEIYSYALSHDFRFLSYGDGCLIFNGAREIRE